VLISPGAGRNLGESLPRKANDFGPDGIRMCFGKAIQVVKCRGHRYSVLVRDRLNMICEEVLPGLSLGDKHCLRVLICLVSLHSRS
jgi:hypothetical protein